MGCIFQINLFWFWARSPSKHSDWL